MSFYRLPRERVLDGSRAGYLADVCICVACPLSISFYLLALQHKNFISRETTSSWQSHVSPSASSSGANPPPFPIPFNANTLILASLLATPFLAKAASPCPTVTKTTHHSYCPSPTPSICAQPDCILLSRLDVPCGCPTVVPTSTSYTACPTACTGACGTDYETIIEPCSTTSQSPTSPTTISTSVIPSSCATITETTGTGCPTLTGCTTEECSTYPLHLPFQPPPSFSHQPPQAPSLGISTGQAWVARRVC